MEAQDKIWPLTRVLRVKQNERIVFPEAQQNINNWVVVGSM